MKKHESAIILKAKPSVQVYDLRSTARVMTTLPFSAGPALLRFHPRYSGTLLIASTSGAFTLSQTPATSYTPIVQVSGRRSPGSQLVSGRDTCACRREHRHPLHAHSVVISSRFLEAGISWCRWTRRATC